LPEDEGGGGPSRCGLFLIGHSSSYPDPPGREELAVATDDKTELDQDVDGVSNRVLLSNGRYASLTFWTMRLFCRHRYARL
jgi:hypothetical protein